MLRYSCELEYTLHWMSLHSPTGQAPQHSGHTYLPQPPGTVHFEKVLTSLARAPMCRIDSRSISVSSFWPTSVSGLAYTRRAVSYTQHTSCRTLGNLRCTRYIVNSWKMCRESCSPRTGLGSSGVRTITWVPVTRRTYSSWSIKSVKWGLRGGRSMEPAFFWSTSSWQWIEVPLSPPK